MVNSEIGIMAHKLLKPTGGRMRFITATTENVATNLTMALPTLETYKHSGEGILWICGGARGNFDEYFAPESQVNWDSYSARKRNPINR